LADYSKDRGVVANWPELAPAWREQVHDRDNWGKFTPADFTRLKEKNGSPAVIEASHDDAGHRLPSERAVRSAAFSRLPIAPLTGVVILESAARRGICISRRRVMA